ncbi:hypothetical protein WOLCODRAFT_165886 [Wolfiporia cocos MD-104 SS10]|uniref:Uncharacterized protein n=1 Tax=Wolfiporia cocos (strain MD-104) TaxID=742152 RepID=A0A2H3IYT6_WOLCO|nr:hypothetical protein WOLCODRAFT_165886 [Wolfiporia cocos MD-104 SS10]
MTDATLPGGVASAGIQDILSQLPPEQGYSWISNQRQIAEEYILHLNIAHNALSRINRLPVEIFADIVLRVKSDKVYQSKGLLAQCRECSDWLPDGSTYCRRCTEIRTGKCRKWTGVTQVCRHWRVLCLSIPQLWTTVNMNVDSPLQWLNVLLERSGDAPMEVIANLQSLNGWGIVPAWKLLESHAHRIRSFRLFHLKMNTYGDWYDEIQLLILKAMLRLEVLDVTVDHNRYDLLQAGVFPEVRNLYLKGDFVPLRSIITRSLRHLELRSLSKEFHFSDIFEILGANTGLELLVMTNMHPSPDEYDKVFPRVSLPNLKALCLGGAHPAIAKMLAHLILPSGVHIFIKYEMFYDYVEWADILPTDKSLLPILTEARTIRTITGFSPGVRGLPPSLHTSPLLVASAQDNAESASQSELSLFDDLHWRGTWDLYRLGLPSFLSAIMVHFSTAPVTNLDFSLVFEEDEATASQWRAMLQLLPNLRRLAFTLKYSRTLEFSPDLSSVFQALAGPESVCPNLRVLYIKTESGVPLRDGTIDGLVACLQSRAKQGMILECLDLDCAASKLSVMDEKVQQLQSLVAEPIVLARMK